jgi:hypothetical protein
MSGRNDCRQSSHRILLGARKEAIFVQSVAVRIAECRGGANAWKMPFSVDMTKGPERRPEKQKDCNEGIRLTRTTTKANRNLDRKETNDLPEKRSV